MPTRPLSPYGVAKLLGEHYLRVFAELYGLETLTIRYFNVFGPRQDPTSPYAAVIPKFLKAIAAGESPVIFGDGTQSRDFTYVDNVVAGNLLAATVPGISGETMNVACSERVTLLDLHAQLCSLLGRSVKPRFAPPRAGDVQHSLADIGKARRLLGYSPVVPFAEGLRRLDRAGRRSTAAACATARPRGRPDPPTDPGHHEPRSTPPTRWPRSPRPDADPTHPLTVDTTARARSTGLEREPGAFFTRAAGLADVVTS